MVLKEVWLFRQVSPKRSDHSMAQKLRFFHCFSKGHLKWQFIYKTRYNVSVHSSFSKSIHVCYCVRTERTQILSLYYNIYTYYNKSDSTRAHRTHYIMGKKRPKAKIQQQFFFNGKIVKMSFIWQGNNKKLFHYFLFYYVLQTAVRNDLQSSLFDILVTMRGHTFTCRAPKF